MGVATVEAIGEQANAVAMQATALDLMSPAAPEYLAKVRLLAENVRTLEVWVSGRAKAHADDAELFAAGKRARTKNQCESVIVATDPQTGIRNYHNCDGDKGHEVNTWHGCGDGETWDDKTRAVSGPLVEVAFT